MDGLICFPWELCFPLPCQRLGRIPRFPRAGGSVRSSLGGRGQDSSTGSVGSASPNTVSSWWLAPLSNLAKPGLCLPLESLLQPKQTQGSRNLKKRLCCCLLTKGGNSVSHHRAKLVENPLSVLSLCPLSLFLSFPPDSPLAPSSEDWVLGTFLGEPV